MKACAVPQLMAKDPRFQVLKEDYKDKHYSDDHLAQALQLCREYHDYSDDWYPVTSAQKGVFTRFMNNYLMNAKIARTQSDINSDSLYNLYTTLYGLYTPEQLDHRISMLARDFRELVDRLEALDKKGSTRQELILAQADEKNNGFVNLMRRVFDAYEKRYSNADTIMQEFDRRNPNATAEQREEARKRAEYRAQEYKTILANKERLAALAAPRIGEDEGFVVRIKDFQVNFDTLDDTEENQHETTGEDREEGSKGDRYADFRTLKLINTLSVRARRLISKVPKVDANGKVIRDDLGVAQYIGGRQVAVVLKKVLVNSSPESIMGDLEAASDFYPWIRGLVNMLQKDPDARTTVYDNFKSAESTYVYVDLENGKYTPHIANTRSAGNAMMREAGNNLRAGYVLDENTSLYVGYGALKSLDAIQKIRSEFDELKKLVQSDTGAMWIKMVEGDSLNSRFTEELIDKAQKEGKDASYLRLAGSDAMEAFLAANPALTETIANMLRGMGFAVSENDVRTIATQTMSKKGFGFVIGRRNTSSTSRGRNKLYQLVEFMDGVYNRAEEILKKGQTATGQYLYNTSDSFSRINRCLALAQYKDVEARVVSDGKSLSTYNNVNLLHQTFDQLMNKQGQTEGDYQAMLENEYIQFEGMAIGDAARRQVYGWLRKFQTNEDNIREKLRVIDISSFNHVEYARLSRAQKLTNSLIMYLEAGSTFQEDKYSAYEVPIQADYSTAYNFILAPRLSTEGEDSELLEALTDEVLIELERIDALEARLKNDNRVKLKVYEKQGTKFQLFPEFNTNGFREAYTALTNPEEARNFVRGQVREQLSGIVTRDIETIEKSHILSNPAMKQVNFGYGNKSSMYAEDGKFSSLSEEAQDKLREYFLNVFYAREQMTKLLTGGVEQFNGLIDFEKRNMLTHATRSSLYTEATWNGERVGKENQNVVYIEDDNASSEFLKDIKEMLHQLLDKKLISQKQFDSMVSAYSKIKTTDGQGLRTLESYRTVMIMADQWDEKHETAYKNIMYGSPSQDDIEIFMQNIKPVLTGYETVPAAEGKNQKPVKLTVLHKYSEQVLLPLALSRFTCLQAQSSPMRALEKAQKQLKVQGREIDMFLFHSGVKVGAHSIIQPFARWKDIKGGIK